jgi:pyruvate dehydrogenase E1 component alpha subunit
MTLTVPAGLTGPAGPPPAEADGDDLARLLLIRHFELALLELFAAGALNGTTHTCLGQEYVPVSLRPLLRADDFVFSNHRGHGHYLSRFDDPAGLLAEIMGRTGAVCDGVGGSQHILRRTGAGGYLSTGVQGESLPVAAGVATHLRRRGDGALALAHIGDGTWGEGAVYEALNIAALWRLPLLVVVENNGIAQSTPTAAQLAGTIAGRAAAFGIGHHLVTATDLGTIRAELAGPIDAVRHRPQPFVVEFVTHRVGPHSKGDDSRSAAERQAAAAGDWYPLYRAAYGERFAAAEDEQRDRVAAVVAEVSARPPARWSR